MNSNMFGEIKHQKYEIQKDLTYQIVIYRYQTLSFLSNNTRISSRDTECLIRSSTGINKEMFYSIPKQRQTNILWSSFLKLIKLLLMPFRGRTMRSMVILMANRFLSHHDYRPFFAYVINLYVVICLDRSGKFYSNLCNFKIWVDKDFSFFIPGFANGYCTSFVLT